MGTATPVPETRSMSGGELPADDACAATRRCGGRHLIRDAYVRFGYGDGTGNARVLAPASPRERQPVGSGR